MNVTRASIPSAVAVFASAWLGAAAPALAQAGDPGDGHVRVGRPGPARDAPSGAPPADAGVRVIRVPPGATGATAALAPGDVIIAVNGRPAAAGPVARAALGDGPAPEGDRVLVRRPGEVDRLVIIPRLVPAGDRLADGPASLGTLAAAGPAGTTGRADDLALASLPAPLARHLGLGRAVLVLQARDGVLSLRDGDIVKAIDGREPGDAARARDALAALRPASRVALSVVRDGRPLELASTVPPPVRATARAPAAPGESAFPERR